MHNPISRRGFLIGLVTALGAAGLSWGRRLLGQAEARPAATFGVDLPFVTKGAPGNLTTSTPTLTETPPAATWTPASGSKPKVIHVHSLDATFWDFGNNYYGNYVNQNVVNAMVDRGVQELTGTSSVAQAWRTLVPNYAPGKAIAIKVNFNNNLWCDSCQTNCEDWTLKSDALIHPINSVIRGLVQAYSNFNASDIWVYDATQGNDPASSGRKIPLRFRQACQYPGVRFFDIQKPWNNCNEIATYSSSDLRGVVVWRNPPNVPTPPAMRLTDVLVNAAYVINMPIMRAHIYGITLGFKNHFGSLAYVEPLHDWITAWGPNYGGAAYNPLVDIYRNSNILDKTVLTIGDGLFGNPVNNISKPVPWATFGSKAPNSLFFAADPVAIDCVMGDLLASERSVQSSCFDYLRVASNAGLGVFERGNPWTSAGYTHVDYRRIEL